MGDLRAAAAAAVAMFAMSVGLAHADGRLGAPGRCGSASDPPPPAESQAEGKPWETGTSPEQRDEAYRLFTEGNDHYVKRQYPEALDRYQRALALFAHPRIHLSMVRTLLLLGRPVEADRHLVESLRYGSAPFEEDEYAEALAHRATLARQLAVVSVACDTAQARVTLDADDLLTCPGRTARTVMPGRHVLVGKKSGYLTATREIVAEAGKCTSVPIRLVTLRSTTAVTVRRWPRWRPWAVVSAGAVVAAAGVALQLRASSNMQRFRDRVSETCGTDSCELPASLRDLESRAELQNRLAIASFGLGAAAIAAGAVLLYFNREQTVIRDVTTVAPPSTSVSLQPGADLEGFAVTFARSF